MVPCRQDSMLARRHDDLVSSSKARRDPPTDLDAATGVARLVASRRMAAKRPKAATHAEAPRQGSALVTDVQRTEKLNVRVPRGLNVRFKKLEYLFAERGIDTNKAELVHMWLAQLPDQVTDEFVQKLSAFRKAVQGTSRAGR